LLRHHLSSDKLLRHILRHDWTFFSKNILLQRQLNFLRVIIILFQLDGQFVDSTLDYFEIGYHFVIEFHCL
jgi:hypothetical protein